MASRPNTAENFFSILKRGIHGVYQHVGKGHLGAYVPNHRKHSTYCTSP